jgi:hypothetical protein
MAKFLELWNDLSSVAHGTLVTLETLRASRLIVVTPKVFFKISRFPSSNLRYSILSINFRMKWIPNPAAVLLSRGVVTSTSGAVSGLKARAHLR